MNNCWFRVKINPCRPHKGEIGLVFGPDGAVAKFVGATMGPLVVRRGDVLSSRTWADIGVLTREQPATPEAHRALVAAVTGAFAQMVARAHGKGMTVHLATIMPFSSNAYYHPGAASEADRQAINAWVRTPGNADRVIDFDRLMRDPARPDRLLPAYDSGDGLHPSIAGYRAMAEGISLASLR